MVSSNIIIVSFLSLLLRLVFVTFGGRRVLSTPSCDQREQATQVSVFGEDLFGAKVVAFRAFYDKQEFQGNKKGFEGQTEVKLCLF